MEITKEKILFINDKDSDPTVLENKKKVYEFLKEKGFLDAMNSDPHPDLIGLVKYYNPNNDNGKD